jgi:hypothetical protein
MSFPAIVGRFQIPLFDGTLHPFIDLVIERTAALNERPF